MSQKPTKPLTPSHSTMKNAVFNFEDIPFNSSSQPISTDSPFPRRDLESRSNSMKINNARKNRSGKLALLLDNSKPSRVSIFTKNNKTPVSSMTSLSPGRRGFKSNKVSDQEKGGRLKEFSSNKSYMRMDSDKEAQFKAILKLNSTDAAMDVYNKETQRPRKHKKGHKLSSGCKDNLLQGQSFNQMSCNMSHLSDTSCFISGLTNIALQNASISQQVPYNSPKHTLLTTVQSQIIDHSSVTPPKVSLKSKKNSSIDKAHLVHSVTAQSGLPYHRKTGAISSNSNEPSVLGKSFSKLEQRRSCVSHASPNNKVRKSTSRDTKTGINKLSELRSKFDAMIGNCDSQIAGALESKNILRNMKQEYEAIIEGLLKGQEKDSTIENKRLREENTRMKIEIAELKSEQEKLQLVIKNMKDTRGNSPCQSGITTEKRGPNIKSIDSPPLTQSSKLTSSKGDKETERLNQILMRQQGTISTLRKKEAKMMKLIYAIRKQGVSVEKIYDEEVKGKYDQGIATLNKLEMVQVEADDNTTERRDIEKQESIMQDSEADASVDYDAIDLENNSIMMGKGDAKLNTAMKNKLKLDFTALKKPEGSHNVKNSIGEPVEFHEEFMSKFEEFSLSWRQECMLQKNP